ncbi:glycoside hydrolase [Exidia glandulosa HHB12029]|uniref:Glycoside hydrolase n=1 Tax=Exidia glandulosa HHB12029 TaxID=1314781 RepID=A0A165FZI3_EXIGL|nr:glycoside hydrolase [Exidia glandulosa HHB12029]
MPRVPTLSPATGASVPHHYVHTTTGQFVDTSGRTLIFRGVNLSGSSKAPLGEQSQKLEDFWENAEAGGNSFIGRPLNVDDGSADVHLARLRGWGFNMLRFPVTWEALEHAGPGQYDFEFMDYVIRVLQKCKDYGFRIFMDPHQDVWSRFTGGSGAPLWTIYACGMNPRNFTAGRTHMLHCEWPSPDASEPSAYPAMMWSTNYGRLGSQTLYTMFFGGRDFAPKCIIDGVNIQDYLQDHFITAFGLLADRIRERAPELYDACIVGWDSLNEPAEGLIGYPDVREPSNEQSAQLKKGPFAYPAQSFKLGMGQPQTVENWDFGGFGPSKKGTVTIDPQGVRAWLDPQNDVKYTARWGWKRDPGWTLGTCVWALHGVWDIASGEVLVPNYFARETPFTTDYWRPHWKKWIERIRPAHPESIHFVQPPVFALPPPLDEADTRGRVCYAPHYYDGLTLVSRHWNWYNADALGVLRGKYSAPWQAVKIGEGAIRKSIQEQLTVLKDDCPTILGDYPSLIGEIGIPFDMDDRWSYGYTDNGKGLGNYKNQQKALDASLNACDGPNALNYTLWTYCPDNSHEWGDGWNLEDLSIWSVDDLRSHRKPGSDAFASHAAVVRNHEAPGTPPPEPVTLPGSSALNLAAVLPSPSSSNDKTLGDITSIGGWDNAWDFLTDGARAAAAFVRPYPMAIVGVPVHWELNAGKASFTFTVRVSADDAAPEDDECNPPTEIYVPLVHFASDKTLMGIWADDDGEQDEDKNSSRTATPAVGQSATASQVDLSSIPPSNSGSKDDLSLHKLHHFQARMPGTTNDNSEVTLLASHADPHLAVDVRVSDGRWEMTGQTLRWWYRVPSREEGSVEYKIEVKRQGGPIKLNELGRPIRRGSAQSRSWSAVCSDLLDCFS